MSTLSTKINRYLKEAKNVSSRDNLLVVTCNLYPEIVAAINTRTECMHLFIVVRSGGVAPASPPAGPSVSTGPEQVHKNCLEGCTVHLTRVNITPFFDKYLL